MWIIPTQPKHFSFKGQLKGSGTLTNLSPREDPKDFHNMQTFLYGQADHKGGIQKTKTGKIASKKHNRGGGGGVSDAKKTQLFPQKVISMQYRPKIQEYRPSCGKKGHNGKRKTFHHGLQLFEQYYVWRNSIMKWCIIPSKLYNYNKLYYRLVPLQSVPRLCGWGASKLWKFDSPPDSSHHLLALWAILYVQSAEDVQGGHMVYRMSWNGLTWSLEVWKSITSMLSLARPIKRRKDGSTDWWVW